MTRERKIEAALGDWFREEGWSLQINKNSGDRIAIRHEEVGDLDEAEFSVNLTELAAHLVREVQPC